VTLFNLGQAIDTLVMFGMLGVVAWAVSGLWQWMSDYVDDYVKRHREGNNAKKS
jgi:hypothetical protein